MWGAHLGIIPQGLACPSLLLAGSALRYLRGQTSQEGVGPCSEAGWTGATLSVSAPPQRPCCCLSQGYTALRPSHRGRSYIGTHARTYVLTDTHTHTHKATCGLGDTSGASPGLGHPHPTQLCWSVSALPTLFLCLSVCPLTPGPRWLRWRLHGSFDVTRASQPSLPYVFPRCFCLYIPIWCLNIPG